MKQYVYILILIFIQVLVKGQGELFDQVEIETPDIIKTIHGENIVKTYSVDFNGDNKLDYISEVKTGLNDEPITREYWYTSDFKFYRQVDLFIMDYDFKCFINLDDDSIPEIIRADGYSDGIDYYITKQDTVSKDEKVLVYFYPIIYDNKKEVYYWGHPWRLDSLIQKKENDLIRMRCSINHKITRDSEIHYPDDQIGFPIIMFCGEPKSEYDYSNLIGNSEWLTIEELINKVKK